MTPKQIYIFANGNWNAAAWGSTPEGEVEWFALAKYLGQSNYPDGENVQVRAAAENHFAFYNEGSVFITMLFDGIVFQETVQVVQETDGRILADGNNNVIVSNGEVLGFY